MLMIWPQEARAALSEGFCPDCKGALNSGLYCRACGIRWSTDERVVYANYPDLGHPRLDFSDLTTVRGG